MAFGNETRQEEFNRDIVRYATGNNMQRILNFYEKALANGTVQLSNMDLIRELQIIDVSPNSSKLLRERGLYNTLPSCLPHMRHKFHKALDIIRIGEDLSKDVDEFGRTALFYICNGSAMKYLLQFENVRKIINQVDNEGRSAMFYIFDLDSARILYKAGADLEIIDNYGRRVIDYRRGKLLTLWLKFHSRSVANMHVPKFLFHHDTMIAVKSISRFSLYPGNTIPEFLSIMDNLWWLDSVSRKCVVKLLEYPWLQQILAEHDYDIYAPSINEPLLHKIVRKCMEFTMYMIPRDMRLLCNVMNCDIQVVLNIYTNGRVRDDTTTHYLRIRLKIERLMYARRLLFGEEYEKRRSKLPFRDALEVGIERHMKELFKLSNDIVSYKNMNR